MTNPDKTTKGSGRRSLNKAESLDHAINRFGFWSVIVVLATGVIAMIFPLDVPGGYTAEHADRVAWLSTNSGVFIAGWVNQIVAMFSLSAVFACGAWHVAGKKPFRAILAATFVLISVVAFIIPKFIAVWTIPLLAETIAAGATGADMAHHLLPLLNVSIPFSLYTSFDYLGFWLYSVFALLAAAPLYGDTLGAKVGAVTLGMYGVIYHALLIALFLGAIAAVDIEVYFIGASMLLLIHIVAMAFVFRKSM